MLVRLVFLLVRLSHGKARESDVRGELLGLHKVCSSPYYYYYYYFARRRIQVYVQ